MRSVVSKRIELRLLGYYSHLWNRITRFADMTAQH